MDKRYKPDEVRKRVIEIFSRKAPVTGTGPSLLANLKGLVMKKTGKTVG